MTTHLSRGIVLRFMREALKEIADPQVYLSLLLELTLKKMKAAGCTSSEHFKLLRDTDPVAIFLTEGYQQLLAFGYIVPKLDTQGGDLKWPWFSVTEIGRRWADGSDPVPEDSQGYLQALDKLVPNIDPVIRQYIVEALDTYQHRSLFASAVMIGAASEKAVYLLMSALSGSVKSATQKKTIKNAIERHRKLPTMFNLMSKHIERAKKCGMPYGVHEGADTHLRSLQEAIRVQRNEAVHPQVGQVDLETVRLTLAAFPSACKKTYDLIDWFNKNQF